MHGNYQELLNDMRKSFPSLIQEQGPEQKCLSVASDIHVQSAIPYITLQTPLIYYLLQLTT